MSHFVYVLFSQGTPRTYVGETRSIVEWLNQHNAGKVRSTKAYRPWRCVHLEEYSTRAEALVRERWLKSPATFRRRMPWKTLHTFPPLVPIVFQTRASLSPRMPMIPHKRLLIQVEKLTASGGAALSRGVQFRPTVKIVSFGVEIVGGSEARFRSWDLILPHVSFSTFFF
jgi:putative endonuclease